MNVSSIKKYSLFILGVLFIQFIFLITRDDSNTFLPSPIDVLLALIDQLRGGGILTDIMMSVKRVLIGFILAAISAIPLAILCSYDKRLNTYVKPIIELLRPIPPIAWIPIAILVFGLGNGSSYFIVSLGAFFPIFVNTYFGASSLPVVYRNVSLSFEMSTNTFIRRVLFYFALPYIFTGLKIGIGMAWMSLIAAELIGAQSGLGYFIQLNRLLLRTDNVILGMILIGIIGYTLTQLLTVLEKCLLPWLPKNK